MGLDMFLPITIMIGCLFLALCYGMYFLHIWVMKKQDEEVPKIERGESWKKVKQMIQKRSRRSIRLANFRTALWNFTRLFNLRRLKFGESGSMKFSSERIRKFFSWFRDKAVSTGKSAFEPFTWLARITFKPFAWFAKIARRMRVAMKLKLWQMRKSWKRWIATRHKEEPQTQKNRDTVMAPTAIEDDEDWFSQFWRIVWVNLRWRFRRPYRKLKKKLHRRLVVQIIVTLMALGASVYVLMALGATWMFSSSTEVWSKIRGLPWMKIAIVVALVATAVVIVWLAIKKRATNLEVLSKLKRYTRTRGLWHIAYATLLFVVLNIGTAVVYPEFSASLYRSEKFWLLEASLLFILLLIAYGDNGTDAKRRRNLAFLTVIYLTVGIYRRQDANSTTSNTPATQANSVGAMKFDGNPRDYFSGPLKVYVLDRLQAEGDSILVEIIAAESRFRQWEDGDTTETVALRNTANSDGFPDVGLAQIHDTPARRKQADSLAKLDPGMSFDYVNSAEGNLNFARFILETEGVEAWKSSKCVWMYHYAELRRCKEVWGNEVLALASLEMRDSVVVIPNNGMTGPVSVGSSEYDLHWSWESDSRFWVIKNGGARILMISGQAQDQNIGKNLKYVNFQKFNGDSSRIVLKVSRVKRDA